MHITQRILALPALALALASCVSQDGSTPFQPGGRSNGRDLNHPPRYQNGQQPPNSETRFMEAKPVDLQAAADNGVDPRTIPPGYNTNPPAHGGTYTAPIVDPGLTVAPPVPGAPVTPTAPVTPPPAAAGEVPFARQVPGKPGYVYSPKDGSKMISVEGLRAGQKAKDPETGEIFRVPYQ